MAPTWPVPSPETPSVQQTWVPAALKWRVHATLSRSLIMSSLLSTSTRGLLPHHLAIWEWHVDRGILHAAHVVWDNPIHRACWNPHCGAGRRHEVGSRRAKTQSHQDMRLSILSLQIER